MTRLIFAAGGGIVLPPLADGSKITVRYTGDAVYYAVADVTRAAIGDKRPDSWAVPRGGSEVIVFRGGKNDRGILTCAGAADIDITLELPAVAPAAEPG